MKSLATVLFLLVAWAGTAEAKKQVRYVGPHPITLEASAKHTFCYIEVPHVHVYTPQKDVLYREHDGANHFVGDPVAFGYDGPKHTYYGHHPIAVDVVLGEQELDGDEVEVCYLDGPHYHSFAPAAELKFEAKGGVHFFVGDMPAEYKKEKVKLAKINAVYKPIQYSRPVVVVDPPPTYHGEVWVTPVAADVHVVGPAVRAGVEVHVPVPSIEVHVPGVVIDTHVHHKHKHKKHGKWKRHGKGGHRVKFK